MAEESTNYWSVLLVRDPRMRSGRQIHLAEGQSPREAGYGTDVLTVALSKRYATREEAVAAGMKVEGDLKAGDPTSEWTISPKEHTLS